MKNAIETFAEWMDSDEATQLIDQINRMPIYERKPTARRIGERLRISNRERETLRLWTMTPFNMTDEQLKEFRKAKKRARDEHRRRKAGKKPHVQSRARLKPWEARGISRRTWFRRQAKNGGTNKRQEQECRGTKKRQAKLLISRAFISATEQAERPKGLPKVRQDRRQKESKDSASLALAPTSASSWRLLVPTAPVAPDGNGAEPPPVIPMVSADAASIAAAKAALDKLIAERDRLHTARNLMPLDDDRLRKLRSDVPILATQIKMAERMV